MEYRTLGQTDIQVSAIALGCWAFAGDETWGPQEDDDSIATVHAALDLGISFFDTAEGYGAGRSEEALGRALQGRREEAIIATKVSPNHLDAKELVRACERSLKYLGTDYIDLYQVHWPSRTVQLDETLAAMEKLRDAGKIRAIGVCNFGPGDMATLRRAGRAETNQLPYNLLWRVIEREIQPLCVEQGMGILCYSPMAQGLLTGKFSSLDEVPDGRARTRHYSSRRVGARHGEPGCEVETLATMRRIAAICDDLGQPMAGDQIAVSLAWVLRQAGVASVLAGARRPEQIRANAGAIDGDQIADLDEDTMWALTEATEPLTECLGANPDPYQGSGNSRYR